MQNRTKIRKRIPIRRRFLFTVLLTTILSILAVSISGFICIRWIHNATEKNLTGQLENNLRVMMKEKSNSVDAKLNHYEKYIEFITEYIENMFSKREEMISRGRIFYPPEDTKEYALTRGFASEDLSADALQKDILFYSNLENIWDPLAKENENLISTIYLGNKDGLLVSYDRYSYLSATPPGKELVYNYYDSEWYQRGMKEDGILYTGVYLDSQGRGLTITIASGITDENGEKVGVVCMDFDLSELYNELCSVNTEDDSIFIFALDHTDTIISPESDTLDLKEYTGLTQEELEELKSDPDGLMTTDDSIYITIPLERVGWTLCVRATKDIIQQSIFSEDILIRNAILVFIGIVILILIAAVIAVNKSVKYITDPLEQLEQDIKKISDGDLSNRATVYRNDEIGDITSGMNAMVDRLNFTMNELMSSQKYADNMSRLATQDPLTGIRNKTAFNKQAEILTEGLERGEKDFGFAMIDLNNLKIINDNYGHEKGDIAIKNLCHIVCETFAHSPVFRVGGDEFVVVLMNEDYQHVESLVASFRETIRKVSEKKNDDPWNCVSAAIGYALFDETQDSGTDSVLDRADKEMYICKKTMKGLA